MREERVVEIPIELIKKLDNSRLRDNDDIAELMEDIKHRGLLQPIGVFQEGEHYIIRFGNRRLECFKKLGYKSIPCIVSDKELDEDSFLADNVAENLHRKDLTPIEFGKVCLNYKSKGYSISEICAVLSSPKNKVENAIKMMGSVPEEIHKDLAYIPASSGRNKKGKISASIASAISRYNWGMGKEKQRELYEYAKSNDNVTAPKINLIKGLISDGKSVEEAIKEHNKYRLVTVTFVVLLEEYSKYSVHGKTLFYNIIKGKIKSNKYLLFS